MTPPIHRPTPRDIQVFVAGALAIGGLHSLIALPRRLALAHGAPGGILVVTAFTAITLLLGIGILLRSGIALRFTKIYLFVVVLLGLAGLLFSAFGPNVPILRETFFRVYASSLLVYLPLLALLLWSQWHKALRDETVI